MKNEIAALTKTAFAMLGKMTAMILVAAVLTYVVLQLRLLQQSNDLRQNLLAEMLQGVRDVRDDMKVTHQRLDELERTMWGEIWPKIDTAQTAKERVVVVPALRNRDQEILKRLTWLEARLLRHMSDEH